MASRSLGTLTLDLVARIGGFEAGMGKAEREAERRSKAISNAINKAAEIGMTAFAGLATAGIAAFAVLNRQADNIAGFQDLADKVGDTAEAVASLKLASDVSGVSLDTVGAASIRLTASLSKTDDESKAVGQAIKALGLSFKDFKDLSPVDQMEAVAKAMNGFADGSEKTAVAVALFGKAGAELIPFMNDLADGAERQISLTSEQIKQADDYTKAQARLKSEFESFIQFQTAQAIPTMTAVQEVLSEIAKNETTVAVATDLVKTALGAAIVVFQTLAVVGSDVGFVFLSVGREIGAWAAQLTALARGDLQGFRAISDAVKADGERARAELDKFQKRVMDIGKPVYMDDEVRRLQNRSSSANAPAARPRLNTSGLSTTDDKAAKEAQRAAEQAAKEARSYLENLQKQLQATENLSVAETVLADIRAGRLKLAGGVTEKELVDLAKQIDMAKEMEKIEKEFKKLDEEAIERKKKLADAGKAVYEDTRTPIEDLNTELQKLDELLARGAISWDTYGRAVFKAQDAYDAAAESGKKAMSEMDRFVIRAQENVQDAFGDGLFNIMQGNFQSIGDGFKQMIDRMVAEALAAQLAEKIFGQTGSDGKRSGGGWLDTAINLASQWFAPGKANGGGVSAGGLYEVNENGPEMLSMGGRDYLMMGNQGGTVTPTAQGGKTISIAVNVTAQQNVSRETALQQGQRIGQGIQLALARNG